VPPAGDCPGPQPHVLILEQTRITPPQFGHGTQLAAFGERATDGFDTGFVNGKHGGFLARVI
jgi:hypothetical protein